MAGRSPLCASCSSALGVDVRHLAVRPCWTVRKDLRQRARRSLDPAFLARAAAKAAARRANRKKSAPEVDEPAQPPAVEAVPAQSVALPL